MRRDPPEEYDDYMEIARSLLGGHESLGELQEANEYINAALHLRPTEAGAWLVKSQILSALDDAPAALGAAEMAVRQTPRDAEALYVRAAVLADMELYEPALNGVDRALRHLGRGDDWLLEDLYYEKASILDALGQCDEALATLEAGLARCPSSTLLKAGIEPLRRERMRQTLTVIPGGKDEQ